MAAQPKAAFCAALPRIVTLKATFLKVDTPKCITASSKYGRWNAGALLPWRYIQKPVLMSHDVRVDGSIK